MSTTATKTTKHDDKIKALLKRANYTTATELSSDQVEELNALAALGEDPPVSAIEKIVTGKAAGKATAKKVSVKYPEDVRAAYKRALELTGSPEDGGPKYPLTVKQTDAVKRALASKAKGDIAEANKALADHATNAGLKKIAKGAKDAPKATVIAVRVFLKAHKALKDDRTMYARKGAAIILALREAE